MDSGDRKPPLRRFTAEEIAAKARRAEEIRAKNVEAIRAMRALSPVGAEPASSVPGFAYIGFRAPINLKLDLEMAAAQAGRSLSAEVQFRLERSFYSQAAFAEALALVFNTTDGEISVERIAAWLKRQLDLAQGAPRR
jgi:hypothetical protein